VTLVTGPRQIFFARLQAHFGQRDRSASGETAISYGTWPLTSAGPQTLSGGIAVAAVATAAQEIARTPRSPRSQGLSGCCSSNFVARPMQIACRWTEAEIYTRRRAARPPQRPPQQGLREICADHCRTTGGRRYVTAGYCGRVE
jgi:hypothetical protein